MTELAQEICRRSVATWGAEQAVAMVGLSDAFVDLLGKVEKVSRYDEPVLITGESGVGKEQLAKAIYLLSERCGRPYVSINCPLYREGNLTVSELFGHRKGSFTGAIEDRRGAFDTAHGGVIFLDEIGDLHLSAQAMLLRALATGEFKPLGDDRARSADVRVVAATNRPLDRLVLAQEFRQDLFFRLRYFFLRVPPLRERGDDWRLILEQVLDDLRGKYGVAKHFSPEAMRVLERCDWPGNVRQLISVATMGYAMADGDVIEPEDFAAQLEAEGGVAATALSLHRRILDGESFWDIVYTPFLERELNRGQVRAAVKEGLQETGGSYRRLLKLWRLPSSDYQRFMDFLRHHRLKP